MSAYVPSEVTDIIEELDKRGAGIPFMMPIRSIDGIVCHGSLVLMNMAKGMAMRHPDDTEKRVRIDITARYRSEELHEKMFKADATHEDIVDYIKSLPNLKFCHISSRLVHNKTDMKCYYRHKFMHDIFSEIANDNLKTSFDNCPVCLESCYTKLPCGHHICLQCESKLTECKCPQCRAGYSRCVCYDDDCDCD